MHGASSQLPSEAEGCGGERAGACAEGGQPKVTVVHAHSTLARGITSLGILRRNGPCYAADLALPDRRCPAGGDLPQHMSLTSVCHDCGHK